MQLPRPMTLMCKQSRKTLLPDVCYCMLIACSRLVACIIKVSFVILRRSREASGHWLAFSFGVDVWTMLSFSNLPNALVTEELSQHICPIENYVFWKTEMNWTSALVDNCEWRYWLRSLTNAARTSKSQIEKSLCAWALDKLQFYIMTIGSNFRSAACCHVLEEHCQPKLQFKQNNFDLLLTMIVSCSLLCNKLCMLFVRLQSYSISLYHE